MYVYGRFNIGIATQSMNSRYFFGFCNGRSAQSALSKKIRYNYMNSLTYWCNLLANLPCSGFSDRESYRVEF